MFPLKNFERVPASLRRAFLAVGNFDGVHRGHAQLVAELRRRADAAGARAIILTFDPRPVDILRPQLGAHPLTWTDRKITLLQQVGATDVGVFQTGTWLLGLTAREFFDRVIREQFDAVGMVEGPTFGFGRDRGGDAQILAGWCANAGLDFEIVPPTAADGAIISSSRIRAALLDGRVREAARWIGRPHRVRGLVVRGAGRGAALGVPTANLAQIDVELPADGVYAGRAVLSENSAPLMAAIHVGPNATFDESQRSVEAHLLDFDEALYDRVIALEFVEMIRPTRKFDDVASLLEQIARDISQTRQILAPCEPG